MTGEAWLARYVQRHGAGLHVRKAAEHRVRDRIRRMTPKEARSTLKSFAGINNAGSTPWQKDIVGGWSQSLDGFLRILLGRRAEATSD